MEMFIHIALFLFGVFLIYDGFNSLKKLKENNEKWKSIAIKSSSFNKNIYEEYKQANIIVNQFNKFINILSKLSIIDGAIICFGILIIIFGVSFHLNLSFLGILGIILIFAILSPFILIMATAGSSSDNSVGLTFQLYYKYNTRYALFCNYFEYEYDSKVIDNKKIIQNYDYVKKFNYNYLASDKSEFFDTGLSVKIRFFCILLFYIGLFFFFSAFSFDNSFYQKIISF